VMSGIRNPKPMTIPAASAAWITTMSGSIAPMEASDHRSRARKLLHGPTCTGDGEGAVGPADGPAGAGASCISELLGERDVFCERVGGGIGGRGEGEVGVLEGRRG